MRRFYVLFPVFILSNLSPALGRSHQENARVFCNSEPIAAELDCAFLKNGRLDSIKGKTLLTVDYDLSCSIETANRLASDYSNLFFATRNSYEYRNIALVPAKTLRFTHLTVCRFQQYLSGLRVNGRGIAYGIDNENDLSFILIDPPDFNTSRSFNISLDIDTIESLIIQNAKPSFGENIDAIRLVNVEPVLANDESDDWIVIWKGRATLFSKSDPISTSISISFSLHDQSARFSRFVDNTASSYEWECPQFL